MWIVIIYGDKKYWNWKAELKKDKIAVYGKVFDDPELAKKDWERYAKANNIKKWKYSK